jgi:predicted MFS family arabinose efflux permease
VFVAMAALLATSAFIVLIWLPRHSPQEQVRHALPQAQRARQGVSFGRALADRLVLAVTAHQGLISLASGASFSFLALRLEDGLHVGPVLIGVAFATTDLTGGCAQPLFGRFADRYDRRRLVAAGLAGNAVLLAAVGIVPNYPLVVFTLCLMGGSGALSQVASGAMQVVAGRRAGMGTVLGLGSAANGAGIVVGSVLGGVLVDAYGLAAAFFFGGGVMLAGTVVFLALTRGVSTRETDRGIALHLDSALETVQSH